MVNEYNGKPESGERALQVREVHLLEFNRLAVLANYIDKNATGDFVVSSPMGDNGLAGSKIIADAQYDLVTNMFSDFLTVRDTLARS